MKLKIRDEYSGVITVALARVGNLALGFVLIFVVSTFFTPTEQGIFYTFVSLVGAQYFFDLGVGFILANIAGRQAALQKMEASQTDFNSLTGIMRFACLWGLLAGFIMLVVIGGIGFYIFRSSSVDIPHLNSIWIAYCGLSCLLMAYNMLSRLYEGLGHVRAMALLRLMFSGINVAFITVLAGLGFGLAALPIALLISLTITCVTAVLGNRNIYTSFVSLKEEHQTKLNWRKDIWPFQRGVAVTWLAGYVIFQAQIPILYMLNGPEAAGRFGMCVQIFQAINSSANIFLTYSIQSWTDLAVRRQFAHLRQRFWKVCGLTMSVTLLGCVVVLAGLWALDHFESEIGARLSGPSIILLYAIAVVLNQFYFTISYYFRAFETEIIWRQTLIGAVLILGSAAIFQDNFSERTAVYIFFFVSVFILCGGSLIQAIKHKII